MYKKPERNDSGEDEGRYDNSTAGGLGLQEERISHERKDNITCCRMI
jgi:hypothetical protein